MVTSMGCAYESWMRSWGAAETTVRLRMGVAQTLVDAGVDPYSTTTQELTDYLSRHHWTGWTLATYHSALRNLFGWLADTGQIEVDPMAKMRRPRTPKTQPRPLTSEQASRLLATATPRVRTYLSLALFAGLRAHEIAAIEGRDVTRETIYVVGKGGKPAHIPTHPLVWEQARLYPRDGYWFPGRGRTGHVSREYVSRQVSELMRTQGLEGSIHRCRHTYATTLLRSGVNIRVVQELMRHESLTSTQAYTLVEDSERVAAIGRLTFAA